MQADGQLIESVNFPYSIWELPEGTYQVKARLNEGVTNVTARIQGAIGQTAPPSTQ